MYHFHYLGPVYRDKSCPGKRLTLPAESTLASIYMRTEVHPFAGLPTGDNFSLYQQGFTNL